jgi:hypothetical protein
MAEQNGKLTADYCRQYLAVHDSIVQKPKKNAFDNVIANADLKGCREVDAAIKGEDAEVGGRYAEEVGPGSVFFHQGKLVAMKFSIRTVSYEDAVSDMTKKLGIEPKQSTTTEQNGFGATLTDRHAAWRLGDMIANISEMNDFSYGYLGVEIKMASSSWVADMNKQRDATRPNSLN